MSSGTALWTPGSSSASKTLGECKVLPQVRCVRQQVCMASGMEINCCQPLQCFCSKTKTCQAAW